MQSRIRPSLDAVKILDALRVLNQDIKLRSVILRPDTFIPESFVLFAADVAASLINRVFSVYGNLDVTDQVLLHQLCAPGIDDLLYLRRDLDVISIRDRERSQAMTIFKKPFVVPVVRCAVTPTKLICINSYPQYPLLNYKSNNRP